MNYYEVLGVAMSASDKEIKKAYRKIMREVHPDNLIKSGLSQEEATRKAQLVNEAFNTLSDAEKKRKYDLGLCNEAFNNSSRNSYTTQRDNRETSKSSESKSSGGGNSSGSGSGSESKSKRTASAMDDVRRMVERAFDEQDYVNILQRIRKGPYTAAEKRDMEQYLTHYVRSFVLYNVVSTAQAMDSLQKFTRRLIVVVILTVVALLVGLLFKPVGGFVATAIGIKNLFVIRDTLKYFWKFVRNMFTYYTAEAFRRCGFKFD